MISSERGRHVERFTDRCATFCALAVIPVIVIEQTTTSPVVLQAAVVASWIIWWAFVADAIAKLLAFGRGWLRQGSSWLALAIIVVSYPGLTQIFAATRALQLARMGRTTRLLTALRLMRLATILGRALSGLRRILDPQSFPYVALSVLAVVFLGGAGMYFVEIEGRGAQGLEDALWWAITTVTTVGYGDIVPRTHIGRAVAVVVMVVGITFMSLLTANIASYLSRRNQEEFTDILSARLDALELHLTVVGADVAALRAALMPEQEPMQVPQEEEAGA